MAIIDFWIGACFGRTMSALLADADHVPPGDFMFLEVVYYDFPDFRWPKLTVE